MKRNAIVPEWILNRTRKPVVILFTALAGCTTGLVLIAWIHNSSPLFNTNGYLYYFIWGMVPLSGLVWGIVRWLFRSFYVNVVSLVIAIIGFTSWVLTTPTFNAVGDLIQSPYNLFAVLVWFLWLFGLIALIDLFIGAKWITTIVTLVLLFEAIYISLPINNSSSYVSSKIGVWITGILYGSFFAFIWVVIIEAVLLIYWEVQKKDHATS